MRSMNPTDDNAKALTAAALLVDGLVSVHSEVDEPWPPTALAAGVRLLERSSACAQIGLEGLIEGEATREQAFQAELQAYCIAVAKTAAVVLELPHDDEATRAMLGRAFRAALDERELLPTLALDDHTMLVDATRIAAWSGDAFRACRALQESADAERGSAHERADAMLITLGAATLEALAACLVRAGALGGEGS